MTRILYFFCGSLLLFTGCTNNKQKGLIYFTDFESVKGWTPYPVVSTNAHSGRFSNIVDSINPYGQTFSLPFSQISPLQMRKVKVSIWVYLTEGAKGYLALDIKSPDKKTTLFWTGEPLEKRIQAGSWQKLDAQFSLQNDVFNKPGNILNIYVWNTTKKVLYVDDFKIEFVQGRL